MIHILSNMRKIGLKSYTFFAIFHAAAQFDWFFRPFIPQFPEVCAS